ncbi:MAG: hypothetical protein M9941_11525 [Anaerolineae bacterium]|nr:hypothetical protein [Anaerolineae bacterium]
MRQRDIFKFWLPLYASWLLMTAEGPMITATLNRLPEPIIMVAAAGIVIGLAVALESPIINLLATSTALVKDRQSYLIVRRFTIHWMIGLTLISALLAFTPLFDLVGRTFMGIPTVVADWVQIGLQIMVFWSAAIAWRRFLQGVLIGHRHTTAVAFGTVIRLASGLIAAITLALLTSLPGIVVGALVWMVGVVVEALYVTWAVRPIIHGPLAYQDPQSAETLTYSALFWFHLPLAGTAVLTLLVQPLVVFALTRLPQPTLSLAAWPILFQIMLMARAAALALPETVIALNETPQMSFVLRRFMFTLTGVTAAGVAILIATPLLNRYLLGVQNAPLSVAELVKAGVIWLLLFPALSVIAFGLRGFLISAKRTNPVNMGMALNVIVTVLVLITGLFAQWPGITTAALALNLALIVETIYLIRQARETGVLDRDFAQLATRV